VSTTVFEITMSLDGFVAGPNATVEEPLGEGGEELHGWIVRLPTWRARHGEAADGDAESNAEDALVREQTETTGAVVMGRRMFSGGQGRWEDDPVADGWWGDEPPFGVPVFVVTHHEREPLAKTVRRSTSSRTGSSRRTHRRARPPASATSSLRAARASAGSSSGPGSSTSSSFTSRRCCSAAVFGCSRAWMPPRRGSSRSA
jgi:dihydrofolate reductase